jgi:hypothetical protein
MIHTVYLEGELKKMLLKGDHCTAVSPFANRERSELRKPCFHHLKKLKFRAPAGELETLFHGPN